MVARCSLRNLMMAVAASAALSLCVAGGSLAQAKPDDKAPKSGDNSKAGGAPAPADSPKSDGSDVVDKFRDVKVTVNADKANLVDAIRDLMKSAKADFRIDNELKDGTVSLHLTDMPFKDALATLIKVSTVPVAYETTDGIFHFKLRPEPPPDAPAADPATTPAAKARAKVDRIPLDQLTAAQALRKLTGQFDDRPPMLYQHSTAPFGHGSTSQSGLFGSQGITYNPDGSVTRNVSPQLNILGLLRGLLGGIR
ncbi:MAG TPA: hypothetical protein VKT77_22480 [Chthonomonadaceae bacterium]|nr:hypothetical protein [Chthonomonadaceae bacterium]